MSDTSVLQLAITTMIVVAKLCAPILITALAVGFGISLFQSVTQIQEVTLTFVPKILAVGIVIAVSGNWMLHELVSFTHELFTALPALLQAG